MQKVITMHTLQEEQPLRIHLWSSEFPIAYNTEKS
jgi:hypothetical protein